MTAYASRNFTKLVYTRLELSPLSFCGIMHSSRNSFEMMCFSRFIILQRAVTAMFICSESCNLL